MQDHERLAYERRFAHQYGWLQHTETGDWRPVIQVGLFDAPEGAPLPQQALVFASASKPTRTSYREYLHRLTAFVEQASQRPDWLNPRPSVTLFLDREGTVALLNRVLENAEDTAGVWRFDVCPFVGRRFSRPLLRMPASDLVFSLWMFRTAPDRNPATVERMLATVRRLVDMALDVRGTPYAPYFNGTPDGWRQVLGEDVWKRFSAAKRRFDPKGVLTPGPRIFA